MLVYRTDIHDKMIDKFGEQQQINICIEEMSELIAVLSKYSRYKDGNIPEEIKNKVIEELADVMITFPYLYRIFNFNLDDIVTHQILKFNRMKRWINCDDGIENTTKDRGLV